MATRAAVLLLLPLMALTSQPYPAPSPHCPDGMVLFICIPPSCSYHGGSGDICTYPCNATCPVAAQANATAVCSLGVCELLCNTTDNCPRGADCVRRRHLQSICVFN